MTDKVQKIREEVERLKESGCASHIVICDTLLAFIDSLQEEKGLNVNSLTWEDIKTLQDKSGEVYAEVAKGKDDFYSIYPTEQSFLEEVLKRFKAQKGGSVWDYKK